MTRLYTQDSLREWPIKLTKALYAVWMMKGARRCESSEEWVWLKKGEGGSSSFISAD